MNSVFPDGTESYPLSYGEVRYIQALSAEAFTERYQLPAESMHDILNAAREKQLSYDAFGDWRLGSESGLGYRLLYIQTYPDECTDLFVNDQKWLKYYLVIELVACP